MLQTRFISANRDHVLAQLSKRNFKQTELIDRIIELDELRKSTQHSLDNSNAESKKAAASIGKLMKAGEKEAAMAARENVDLGFLLPEFCHKKLVLSCDER